MSSYKILSQEEVTFLHKKSYNFHLEMAKLFLEPYYPKKPFLKTKKALNLFTALAVFSSIYNLEIQEILNYAIQKKNLQDIYLFFKELKQTVHAKKENEWILIKKGLIYRLIYGTQLSDMFKNNSRIYIKIDDIEKLMPLENLIQETINRINLYVPKENQILFHKERIFIPYKKTQDSVEQTESYRFFVISNNQKIKFGHYLKKLIHEIENIINVFTAFSNDDFKSFVSFFKHSETPIRDAVKSIKKSFYPHIRNISTPLFFEIKKNQNLTKEEVISYLSILKDIYTTNAENIHSIQIKSPSTNSSKNDLTGDTIILSVNPVDISRMSEYTDWYSCMSQTGDSSCDIPFQIGIGTIIAYLVNHKNPYKKLGRILLKPYVKEKEKQQISKLHTYFFKNKEEELKTLKNCILMSFNEIKQKFNRVHQDIQETFLQLNLTTPESKKIYMPDKQYGLSNPFFSKIITKITKENLNCNDCYGSFYMPAYYHTDTLTSSYYFVNPDNPNKLKDFLKEKPVPFSSFHFENEEYFYIKHLYIPDIFGLNLSGIRAKTVETNAENLMQIDTKKLIVENLKITNPEKLFIFPENILVKNALTLKGNYLISVPSGIKTKSLTVCSKNLKIIPADITISELDISSSNISNLPPLNLKYLIAKHTKIRDISHLMIENYIDLSYTPIQNLPQNLKLKFLLLKGCTNIPKLPNNLQTDYLDISQTNIKKIPTGFYSTLIINSTKKLEYLPPDTTFLILEAQNSSLKELPHNLKAKKIDLKKSSIQKLPDNLQVTDILIDYTDISILPSDMIAKNLSAKQTKIKEIPFNLKIQSLILTDTDIEIIHYSEYISSVAINKTPKYIHPNFEPLIFSGLDKESIIEAQKNYINVFGRKTKIKPQKGLNALTLYPRENTAQNNRN